MNYDQQLKDLKDQMLILGNMVEDVIRDTIRALIAQDTGKAREIAEGDEKVNAQVRKIEQDCYTILLRQQPVAKDLRAVSAALKMLTDMERIGDHGADIAELTILMSNEAYSGEIRLIEDMAKETSIMLIEAVNAFSEENDEKAEVVIERDDVVDDLFLKVKAAIAEGIRMKGANAQQELDLLMVAKYLERIGDHATNIAEWVLFSVTGEFPGN